jgi:hypothetical protein
MRRTFVAKGIKYKVIDKEDRTSQYDTKYDLIYYDKKEHVWKKITGCMTILEAKEIAENIDFSTIL